MTETRNGGASSERWIGGQALAVREAAPAAVLDDETIETLRKTIAKELAPDEFSLFIQVAKRLGLSPLAKQIYALKVGGRMVLHVGIDGYRVLAERSRVYGGQLGPYWADAKGEWHDAWFSDGPPTAAKVGILRKDWKEPLWAVARFKSYNRESPNWKQQPDVMLAKAAEALAIRKAFPQELAGAPEYRPEYEGDPDDALADASEAYERLQGPQNAQPAPEIVASRLMQAEPAPEPSEGEYTDVPAGKVTHHGDDFAAEHADILPPSEDLKKQFANLVDEIHAAVPGSKAKLPSDEEPAVVWQEKFDKLRGQWSESERNPANKLPVGVS